MTNQFPDATKMVLSPQVQAVLDAFWRQPGDRSAIAAALSAAAGQVTPSQQDYDEASHEFATACLNGMAFAANELRRMAIELEAQP